MVLNNSPTSTQITLGLQSELYLHHLHRVTAPHRYQKGDFMANNRPMTTEDEKKLLQAQHRMEAIEARNRQKERKAIERIILAALLLSRRAHLLTTHKMGGGIPFGVVRSARLCGSYGALCTMSHFFKLLSLPTQFPQVQSL